MTLPRLSEMGSYITAGVAALAGDDRLEVSNIFGPLLDSAFDDVLEAATAPLTPNIYNRTAVLNMSTAGTYLVYGRFLGRCDSSSTVVWTLRMTDDRSNTILATSAENALNVPNPTQGREFLHLITLDGAANVSIWFAANQSDCYLAANTYNANSSINVPRAFEFFSMKVG